MNTTKSIRTASELAELFSDAEGRALTEDELKQYLDAFPDFASRAAAAQAIYAVDTVISGKIAKEITTAYEYEKNHDIPTKKCFRDISLVVKYATLSMLMNDPDWFRDKLLVWFKTILQSFRFPAPPDGKPAVVGEEHASKMRGLNSFQCSIYETYALLDMRMKESLSPEAYQEIAPYLSLALDILSND